MQAIQQTLAAILRSSQTGARFAVESPDTLLVYDCPVWRSDYQHTLHARHPNVDFNVYHSDESLSGFVVVVRRRARAPLAPWLTAFGLALALFAYTLYRAGTGPRRLE